MTQTGETAVNGFKATSVFIVNLREFRDWGFAASDLPQGSTKQTYSRTESCDSFPTA